MLMPDYPAETGEGLAFGTGDPYDATKPILPEQFAAGITAEFAIDVFAHSASIAPIRCAVRAGLARPPVAAEWQALVERPAV
jgi:hypothetical protein